MGGGAARGFFHIGVLEALEEGGIKPAIVAGTSAGAIVGAFYCAGIPPREILKIIETSTIFKVLKPRRWSGGLLSHRYLERLLSNHLPYKKLEELPLPLLVTATNLNTGKLDLFAEGEIIPVVNASASIPIMFEPVKIDGKMYLDGGLKMNLPASPLKGKCDIVIGVNLTPEVVLKNERLKTINQISARTFDLVLYNNIAPQLAYCDYVISSSELSHFGKFNLRHTKRLYDLGRRVTKAFLSISL